MRLKIAARRSALARIQAWQVGDALCRAHPGLSVSYAFRASLGDQQQDQPLWQMPEKGVFTQDFREDLDTGRCDLVVHSWKDLPIVTDAGTEIAATLPRADGRDVLLLRAANWPAIEQTGRVEVLTSSPRRAYNLETFLRAALPCAVRELVFAPVRGNIQTRVQKLMQSATADGLIVAKAALDRLLTAAGTAEWDVIQTDLRSALAECRWMVLPLCENPAAPAQGALAVEIASRRDDLQALLAAINCTETYTAVQREREILRQYGGGCHQKIGVSVLRRAYGEVTFLRGLTDNGQKLDSAMLTPHRPRPARRERAALWPLAKNETEWCTRHALPVTQPAATEALWVAKADALPADWTIAPEQIVWASGVQTWRRLAQRGIWVNGCAESLGEQEPPLIDTLAGRAPRWCKLTHDDSPAETAFPVLPTYRLVPRPDAPPIDWHNKEYFFWTSGSALRHALQIAPEIRAKTHFCGPGHTHTALLAEGLTPHVFLGHAPWLAEMSL